jgi:hypothetical protein
VAEYRIDPAGTRFDVRITPGPPLDVARVSGVQGVFHAVLIDDVGGHHPSYRMTLRLELMGRTHRLEATGAVQPPGPDGSVRVSGHTEVDPRRLGVPLPPVPRVACRVAWRILLRPVNG